MFRCPHCGDKGISPLRKLMLSPGAIANCKSCGSASGIGFQAWLFAILPGSILMIAALIVDSAAIEWSLNIVGLLLMIILPFRFTSLQIAK